MDRIKSQTAVVSQLLFDPKTAGAYKDIIALTGKIIKEIAVLAWLLICSVFVFSAWFSDVSISSGRKARNWWQAKQVETVDSSQTAAATGQAFLNVSQNGANFLLNKAREQLGLEKVERSAKTNAVETDRAQEKSVAKKTSATAADKVAATAKDAKASSIKEASKPKESSGTSVAEKH